MLLKKVFLIAVLFIVSQTLFVHSAPLPPRVNFFQFIGYDRLRTMSDVRIWGWSRDGKVAYSRAWFTGHGPTIDLDALIFDLVNNTIVWRDRTDDYYANVWGVFFEYSAEEPNDALSSFILRFREAGERYGIEFAQTPLMDFPIVCDGRATNILLETSEMPDDGAFRFGDIWNYRIIAESGGIRSIVREATYDQSSFHLPANIFRLGHFISPFGNVALIAIGIHRHEHGTGLVVDFSLVGYQFAATHGNP